MTGVQMSSEEGAAVAMHDSHHSSAQLPSDKIPGAAAQALRQVLLLLFAQVAAIISSTFYSGWFLMAGFIIPRPRIPGWWIW